MIKNFKHKGLESLFYRGVMKGTQKSDIKKIRLILAHIHSALTIRDIAANRLYGLHPLKGSRKGEYAIFVNKNWRVTFSFRGGHAYQVYYEDYH